MNLVTFNPYRTIGFPNVQYIKPDHMFRELEKIKSADFLLFPENWQVNSLYHGMQKAIFPSVSTIQLGYNKIEMTRALWTTFPEFVPYTEILGSTKENIEKVLETFPFPFVAKEVRNSMGKGVFLIKNKEDFITYANSNDVLYVQEFLESDRDLRICVIGDEIIASYWRIGASGEFHHNVAKGGEISFENIPQDAINIVQNVAKRLHINHAGFDILYSNGKAYILEFNVLFGNVGIREQGINIENKIYKYLLSQYTPPFPTTPISPISTVKKIS